MLQHNLLQELDFQPDLVWLKERASATGYHGMITIVLEVQQNRLIQDTTGAEATR
jgi:hypothetical protein